MWLICLSLSADIVVDLVDSATADISPTSSFTVSSSSFTSPGALLDPQNRMNQFHGEFPFSLKSERSPCTHSSVLRFQTSLQVPNFQEGRRASDTSLPQGKIRVGSSTRVWRQKKLEIYSWHEGNSYTINVVRYQILLNKSI